MLARRGVSPGAQFASVKIVRYIADPARARRRDRLRRARPVGGAGRLDGAAGRHRLRPAEHRAELRLGADRPVRAAHPAGRLHQGRRGLRGRRRHRPARHAGRDARSGHHHRPQQRARDHPGHQPQHSDHEPPHRDPGRRGLRQRHRRGCARPCWPRPGAIPSSCPTRRPRCGSRVRRLQPRFLAARLDLRSRARTAASASDLRFEIDRRFRAGGIEIPFPQRDVHLRSLPASGGPGGLGGSLGLAIGRAERPSSEGR